MHAKPARVLGYARVSSLDQATHGTSLDAQREEITRYAAANGYPEPLIFVEAESGGGSGEARAEQVRLMAMVRAGDLVLVSKQDRWSRFALHFLKSADEIAAIGARFFSIAERFDPVTPEGRFAGTLMAAVAEQELARIRERTIGARRRLRAMGLWVEGPPPLGYRVVERKLVIDEPRAAVVRQIYSLAIAGHPTSAIEAWLSDEGHETDRAAIARRLRDRRYLGDMPARGERQSNGQGAAGSAWIEGTHPPIVDRITWERAQRAVASRKLAGPPGSIGSRTAGFLLRGVCRCGVCDRPLTSRGAPPYSSSKHAGWYLCLRPGCVGIGSARSDRIDESAGAAALERVEGLASLLATPTRATPKSAPDFAAQRARLDARLARLVEAIANGVLSLDDARGRRAELEAERRAIGSREAEHGAATASLPAEVRRAALADVATIRRAWPALKPGERRRIIGVLAERATIARNAPARRWERTGHALSVAWREIAPAPSLTYATLRIRPFGAIAYVLGAA